MQRLLQLIYKYRAFLFFLVLETTALFIFFSYSIYQGSSWFNTSNHLVGEALHTKKEVTNYFDLKSENEKLAGENASLRLLLVKEKLRNDSKFPDSAAYLKKYQFEFIPAHVIRNTITRSRNYFTIDKGSSEGIKPGMGVIGPNGVVGTIRACSEHFSTGNSVLFEKNSVSSKVINTNVLGNTEWSVGWFGGDPQRAKLTYVARHNKIKVGDTIVTSGHSPYYPEGIMIGYVEKVVDTKQNPFFDVTIKFSTDYTSLNHVYIIENNLKVERDTLEENTVTELDKLR